MTYEAVGVSNSDIIDSDTREGLTRSLISQAQRDGRELDVDSVNIEVIPVGANLFGLRAEGEPVALPEPEAPDEESVDVDI